jgi:adenosylmethionine-8-amino-7-oxononanoate aminotransferase
VVGLGHANDKIKDALTSQANELPHAMGDVHPTAMKRSFVRG